MFLLIFPSMPYLKPLLVSFKRHVEAQHSENMGKRRAFFELGQEGLDILYRALRFKLYIAIRHVADPPGNPESRSFEPDKIAEPHALHPSRNRGADPFALF